MDRGFIKLDRKLLEWRWITKPNTLSVWIWLLLNANWEDKGFLDITIKRGSLATTYGRIAEGVGISVQSARTAINHLKTTGELTVKQHPKFLEISIENYDRYQQVNRQSTGNQQATNRQLTTTKELKKLRNKEYIYSAYENVSLSDEEYSQLKKDYPQDYERLIEEVGEWKAKSGAEYKSDYAAIKSFARKQGIAEFEIKDYTIENDFEFMDDGTVRTVQVKVFKDGHRERG